MHVTYYEDFYKLHWLGGMQKDLGGIQKDLLLESVENIGLKKFSEKKSKQGLYHNLDLESKFGSKVIKSLMQVY